MLALPATPREFLQQAVLPALALLPAQMNSPIAQVLLVAIALQESGLRHRWQVLNGTTRKGPARGLEMFEVGTRASRGGCWGVYLHPASRYWVNELCKARGCKFTPYAIWRAIENDDVLAAGMARLLLFTDPRFFPAMYDAEGAWKYYIRNWRPGKAKRATWDGFYRQAQESLIAAPPPFVPDFSDTVWWDPDRK